jgi:hypothetical protein
MSDANKPKVEAQNIYNSFEYEKGKNHIMRHLYDSGSSAYWRQVWNEYQKLEK